MCWRWWTGIESFTVEPDPDEGVAFYTELLGWEQTADAARLAWQVLWVQTPGSTGPGGGLPARRADTIQRQ